MNNGRLLAQRAAALGNKTTHKRGEEKDKSAMLWLLRWGWSSPKIIDAVASPGRRGVARRLKRRGLLQEKPTESGGARGSAAYVMALTPEGRATVEADIDDPDELFEYHGFRTYRSGQLRHDLMVQNAVANWMAAGTFSAYLTPSEIAERSAPGIKHPDAIVFDNDGTGTAIELELTAKSGWRMDEFVWSTVRALQNGSYSQIAVLSPSKGILGQYQRRFAPGASVRSWDRDSRSRPIQRGVHEMPDWVEGRVLLERVEL